MRRIDDGWLTFTPVRCRRSTILSVANCPVKMSVHERTDIEPKRTGEAPGVERGAGAKSERG